MKKRRVHRLLHIVCITGMMLSLCGCSSTKAKETDALIEAIAMDSAELSPDGEAQLAEADHAAAPACIVRS